MATNTPSHSQVSSNPSKGMNKRRRGRTEELGIEEERDRIEGERDRKARTKQRAKELGDSIRDASIDWGSYGIDFLASTVGERELYDFLQRLEKVSTFAKTRADTTARLLSSLRQNPNKLDILTTVRSELSNLLQDDVYPLTDAKSLEDALGKPFRVPLLHRVTASHPSLAPTTNFGIQELLKHLAEDKGASISVYDYSIPDPAKRTRQTTVHEFRSCFRSGNTCRTALNFLDIENHIKIQFCPSPIILQDVTTKLDALIQHDKGKTGSEWRAERPKEFFLAAKRNAISTIHIDTGSMVTWVLILEGRKIWYFPRHVNSRTVRWLALVGSQTPENYEGGWVKVELRPGDLLIMPPSFPHAVFTPDDCLAVGGQFYMAGHLGRSIEGLRLQEDYPDISNENLDDSVYSTLARILNNCSPVMTSLEKSQIASNQSLFPNRSGLATYDGHSKESLIDILKSLGVTTPSRAKKDELLELLKLNSTQVTCTPRGEFLDAFWKLFDEFMADSTSAGDCSDSSPV
ncbi:MAG: Lysine-specific demethylase 2A [Geoglossum simile]|nr:MAG: Lysine-specific demethylase 2A [Geoglossum simile]